MDNLRADSIRVSAAGIIGPVPSDIFCAAVENGSTLFTLFTPYPLLVIGIIAAGLAIVLWALWQSWPTLRETWRAYWSHVRVFAGIGGILVAAPLAVSILQYLLATNPDFAELTQLSEDSPVLQGILGAVSLLTRGLLLVIVTPAVVQAVGDIVEGRSPGVRRSFREGFARIPDLVWTLARGGLIVLALTVSIIGLPWAVNRSVRWMFGSQAAVLGGIRGKTALDDSATAVRGRWWQAAVNGAVLAFIGAAPGVIVALLLLILARFPVDAANSVASLVFALAQPFAIVGLTLLYLRWRGQPVAMATRRGSGASWRSLADSREKHVGPQEAAHAEPG
jgi:hypothetical protein